MTSKQNPVELDACNLILHAAQTGQTFEDYVKRVIKKSRMKCGLLCKGLVE